MECGCDVALMKRMRRRSPSVQRKVGPGMRPSNVQAGNITPGATSTSFSIARTCHSRTVRPSAPTETVPASKSVTTACGSNPFARIVDRADHEIGAVMLMRPERHALGGVLGMRLPPRLRRQECRRRAGHSQRAEKAAPREF